ncbi:Wzz/FepE/Etk N-terminal domain-containing protein [Emticicia sp. C21]|uniref:Wzz/FepE/Etk N-terminal domain-containing protein n=1 Tax=Emticicia sp. C21 TaxID=2302915 RepID=UPI000E341F38|nr:Wzz/FepE/Etk N-terminal domain-containing protein [Emticicia sp. C21]RFS17245.1 lipopolysaccharide biosynthesis protein [Emticicia sp. C21]
MQENSKEYTKINLQALFKLFWKEKTIIIIITSIVLLLGTFYAFTVQEQFESEGRILPELQAKATKFGNLAGLADLAGVDLANLDATEAIRPDLYPDVLRSTPFFLALFNEKIITKDNQSVLFEKFYHELIEKGDEIEKKYMEKPPVKENGFLLMNQITENRIKDLKKRIRSDIDKKSGIITISVKMPDPVVAANVARFSMAYLTEYVTNYRINKAKKDLHFLEERVNTARGKFYSNQTKKAQYGDQFQLPTIRQQSADLQRERIESEYRLSSNFYNDLLKKLEEAKLKVQQETPVFQILEPPLVPARKSEPRKALILFASTVFGGLVSLIVILLHKGNYKKILH